MGKQRILPAPGEPGAVVEHAERFDQAYAVGAETLPVQGKEGV